MERRAFIKNCAAVCVGTSAIALLSQGCETIHYATSSVSGNRIQLKKAEFINDKNEERSFVVVQSPKLNFPICVFKKREKYNAVYMMCTHQGCELKPNPTSLVCPCHGSDFSTSGKVLNPPAEKDLQQFNITVQDEIIYIDI